ncbi:MAG: urocanate hydratase, partial [Bacteroidota bacterium]
KAGNIAGCISVVAEINEKAIQTRHSQGWVDEVIGDLDELVARVQKAKQNNEAVSIAYHGNIVEVWEYFYKYSIYIDLGSDQTSLHNPWAGGYYPVGMTFEQSNRLMVENPEEFRNEVRASLVRHVAAINTHTKDGTYFFDYGNAFLLEAGRAGADIFRNKEKKQFKYPSYVQDIMGPMCFDYGFGPFRWVCTSGRPEDLRRTDQIAVQVLKKMASKSATEIKRQVEDNLRWIKTAEENRLVVGSQARILYADNEGRIEIAKAFNKAIRAGQIGPVVLGRDHHDVSGTDSPYRETSNIYDGSQFTADMAIHNVIGDAFRGASWVSIHNGGGVGWGEVINGGFGLLLDGTKQAKKRLENMLFFDVNNGVARRSWAGNEGATYAIKKSMRSNHNLNIRLAEND